MFFSLESLSSYKRIFQTAISLISTWILRSRSESKCTSITALISNLHYETHYFKEAEWKQKFIEFAALLHNHEDHPDDPFLQPNTLRVNGNFGVSFWEIDKRPTDQNVTGKRGKPVVPTSKISTTVVTEHSMPNQPFTRYWTYDNQQLNESKKWLLNVHVLHKVSKMKANLLVPLMQKLLENLLLGLTLLLVYRMQN